MAQKIGIGVEAQLDTSTIEQQINALGQKIAQANKVQFTPVSVKSTQDVEAMVKRYEQLLKVHGELNRRVKATGQSGKSPWDLDFGAMFTDESVRNRQMQKVLQYTTGAGFHAPVPPAQQPGRPGSGGGGAGGPQGTNWQNTAAQVAGAGLRAAGPAGGIVANSVGTGMSAGFGAGLMGLLGGMLALGVGKLVGGVMEKIGEAETNNIAMDRLKRTLGDVNVAFDSLKSVVHAGATNLKITYAESEKLATQFAKLGNVTGTEYQNLADELGVGVGVSRAFGLDPSQGVGVMGQMRGLGITSSTQESRRFALLIGETIGKAGAFAKADEVMDAMASFAASQTRNNMGAANVAGYAGMFSSMVGSGIPGLDPQGAAGLLARVNSSLSGGGAKGEASQFFTGLVGNRMGLDPIQTQILREGGAFATNSSMFGEGSVAQRYGIGGPGGDKTFLQSSLEELRRQYGNDKGLLAQATSNHLGVGINQAMALLSVQPNAIGEMQDRFGDLSKLSASGIGNISTAMYGKADDRQALARSLKARSDVTAADKDAITAAEGDDSKLRDVLAELSARYGQERTMGSDIRDSKNALDNIKTALADQLVPMTNQMRMGIMHIAGKGEKSSEQVMRDVIALDSKERQRSITGEYSSKLDPLQESLGELQMKRRSLDPAALAMTYRDKPEILEQKHAERAEVERQIGETEKKIATLQAERADLLKKENERRAKEIEQMEKDAAFRAREELKPPAPVGGAPAVPGNQSISRRRSGGSGSGTYYRSPGAKSAGLEDDAMTYFMEQGWSKEQSAGIVSNLVAESQLDTGAVGDGGRAYGIAQWHPDRQAAFKRWAGKDIRDATRQEQMAFVQHELTAGEDVGARRAGRMLKGATSAGEAADIFTRHYERPKHVDRDAATRSRGAAELANRPTPLPEKQPVSARDDQRFIFDAPPIEIIHKNERGETMQTAQLSGQWRRASPFGTERYA